METECKYTRGKIYKVVDFGYSKCYYGSTTEKLYNRFSKQKNIYKQFVAGKRKDRTSVSILFEEFGMENCKIELVENYPCNGKEELNAREGFYIKNYDCVNKLVAGRTNHERYELNKEQLLKRHKELGKVPWVCNVCNCQLNTWNKWKHLKSIKHKTNKEMKRKQEENET